MCVTPTACHPRFPFLNHPPGRKKKAQERNAAKKGKKGKAGGGAKGKAKRQPASSTVCAICRAPFVNAKRVQQLKEHWEGKHGKLTWEQCFPAIEKPN